MVNLPNARQSQIAGSSTVKQLLWHSKCDIFKETELCYFEPGGDLVKLFQRKF